MSYTTVEISKIKKLFIHVTNCRKSMSTVYNELQNLYPNDKIYLLNGGMWNSDGSACPHLKVDGEIISQRPNPYWDAWGYGWNDKDIVLESSATGLKNKKNFISCTPLIVNNKPEPVLSYDKRGQGGTRGRTAIGLINNNKSILLYCTQDGSSGARTPEKLRDELASFGCNSAIMLDSGGSSMCNFDGKTVLKGDGRKVDNWIVIIAEDENNAKADNGNSIIPKYLTNNRCYQNQVLATKKKMMLHSTGTPGANADAIFRSWNSQASSAAVEFVIDDKNIYQMLPLGIKSWHGAGTSNTTHIACEICEPQEAVLLEVNWRNLKRNGGYNKAWPVTQLQRELQALGYDPNGIDGKFGAGLEKAVKQFQANNGLTADGIVGKGTLKLLQKRKGGYLSYETYKADTDRYFTNVYNKAVWLFATILRKVGGKAEEIVCHSEGYKMGIASNHADVMHWFPKHGKTMNTFRSDVAREMGQDIVPAPTPTPPSNPSPSAHWAEASYNNLIKRGIDIADKRFDDNMTRGEVFALADKILTKLGK